MPSPQWSQLLPGRNPHTSLASSPPSILILVSDLCHAPTDSQGWFPSPLQPTLHSLPQAKASLWPWDSTGLLCWGQGKLLRAKVWVFLSISVVPLLGISTLHLLCLPEQKEFPREHQSDTKQREGDAHLQQASPGPGDFEHRAVLRLFGHSPVSVSITETIWRWRPWCLGCAGREGIVDMALVCWLILSSSPFPRAFAKVCDSGAASLTLGEHPVSKESLGVIISEKCVCLRLTVLISEPRE